MEALKCWLYRGHKWSANLGWPHDKCEHCGAVMPYEQDIP